MAAPATWMAPTGVEIPRWTTHGLIDSVDVQTRRAYDVDMAVLPIAIDMECGGIPINLDTLKGIASDQRPDWSKHWDAMQAIVGNVPESVVATSGEVDTVFGPVKAGFNPNSQKQLTWALYDPGGPCKLTCPKKTATGAPSADKDVLAKLADHEFVQHLMAWRKINYVFSNFVFGSGFIIRADGCIHPHWNTTGARSGRWSSSPNWQNLPLWLRKIVEALKGWRIVGADYAQLEARIMAALCGDPDLIQRCRDADETRKLEPEYDLHSFVASNFFKEAFLELSLDDPDEKARRKALREVAKSCLYGLNYGAGASKILEAIYKKGYEGMPLNKQIVQGAVDTIFELFPGVPKWRDKTLAWSVENAQVRSALLGRWRFFPWGDVEATIAWNYPIQSTGADIINLRLVELDRRLRALCPRARFMAQVHDALYVLAPEEDAEAVAECVTDTMTVELPLVEGAPKMVFPASAKIGKTWDEVS